MNLNSIDSKISNSTSTANNKINNITAQTSVRLLLTNKCSARCHYCHNEGQAIGKEFLPLNRIKEFFDSLDSKRIVINEIILSGGEPTLHPKVADIAEFCKERKYFVSIDTHGGHPHLLEKAMPYLDEIKFHIDSFDTKKQMESMGIAIDKCFKSMDIAKKFHRTLNVIINHPLRGLDETTHFINKTREMEIDCKIIEIFGEGILAPLLADIDFKNFGYIQQREDCWLHSNGKHRLFTKRCGNKYNSPEHYFVDVIGVRHYLEYPSYSHYWESMKI